MKQEYQIPLHLFVNLITNSSTEIFVEATNATKSAVIDIVNQVLKAGGSKKTCAELFDISLVIPKDTYMYDIESYTEEDVDIESTEGRAMLKSCDDSDDQRTNIKLVVNSKLQDTESVKAAALFESFIRTYAIDAKANY